MTRKCLNSILIWMIIFCSNSYSQTTGEWLGASIGKDLPLNFKVKLTEEVRIYNSPVLYTNQYFTELELGYKLNKRFDLSFGYRFINKKEENNYYYFRHKLFTDFLFDIPVSKFKIDYRFRIQKQSKTYINSEFDKIPDKYLRNRIKVTYDITTSFFKPFISMEIFYPLNSYKTNTIDEYRAIIGADYSINKKHTVSGGIMINHERFPHPNNAIIFLVSYNFKAN